MFKNATKKYALAQAWLTDNGLTIPVMAGPKETAVSLYLKLFHLLLLTQLRVLKEKTSGYLKYTEVGEKPITKEEYQKAREKMAQRKKLNQMKKLKKN